MDLLFFHKKAFSFFLQMLSSVVLLSLSLCSNVVQLEKGSLQLCTPLTFDSDKMSDVRACGFIRQAYFVIVFRWFNVTVNVL